MPFYIKLHCKDIFALRVTSFSPAINGQSSLQWSQELFQAVCECRDLDMFGMKLGMIEPTRAMDEGVYL